MAATLKAPPKAASKQTFRIKLDSALARCDVTVEASSPDEAKRIVLGWLEKGLSVDGHGR